MKSQKNSRLFTVFSLILIFSAFGATKLRGEEGYRNTMWGSSPEAVKKNCADIYHGRMQEVEDAIIYGGTFQGLDANYKYIFRSDSLVMVAITTVFPWDLSEQEHFRNRFRRSEQEVDDIISRIRGKYGSPLYDEKLGTDQFLQWKSGETDIEFILQRQARYTLLLTYSWNSFFQRSTEQEEETYRDEL